MRQGVTPFEEQLHTTNGCINEFKSLQEGEINTRLSVEGHHLVAILHSSQEGTTSFFYLRIITAVSSATSEH